MTDVKLPIMGGCAFGAVRYEITGPALMIYCCHCAHCQKQSGGAFVLSTAVLETAFRFTKGEPAKTEWTSDAGNQRYGLFCSDCGTRIANGQSPSIGVLSVRAGAFDDASWARPAAHIWTKSAQPWFAFADDDLTFEGQPEDYAPIVERFKASVTFI